MLTHYFKRFISTPPRDLPVFNALECAHMLTIALIAAMVIVHPAVGYGSVLLAIELGVLPSLVWTLRKGTLLDGFDLLGWMVLLSPLYFLLAWFGKHLLA